MLALAPAAKLGYEVICSGDCEEEWRRARVGLAT